MEHVQSLPLGIEAHQKVVESPDKNLDVTFNGRPRDAREWPIASESHG
jgi:hypothetical protein